MDRKQTRIPLKDSRGISEAKQGALLENSNLMQIQTDMEIMTTQDPLGGKSITRSAFTPARRLTQVIVTTHNKAKPQSPKILLPQCFLDQPTYKVGKVIPSSTREKTDR